MAVLINESSVQFNAFYLYSKVNKTPLISTSVNLYSFKMMISVLYIDGKLKQKSITPSYNELNE